MAEATAQEKQKTSQESKFTQGTSRSREEKAWSGNKANEFNVQSIGERTFQVRLPTQFCAKDVLTGVNGVLFKDEVETVVNKVFQGVGL